MPTQIYYWRPVVAGTVIGGTVTPPIVPAVPCDLPLDCMRSAIESTLSGTAYILSLSQAGDGFGGQTDTYGTAGTANCYIYATGKMREYPFADGVRSVPEFQVTVPYGTALYGRNRIVSNGYTYEVTGSNMGETNHVATRAMCVRIDG
jgi:hypothetical protein